jgi:hypothetical protein
MPKFDTNDDSMVQGTLPSSHFGFSATRIEDLGATEYTLVSINADKSGSTDTFKPEMEKVIKAIVRACRRSPRADNLMLRLTLFDNGFEEVHGFKPLGNCNEADYDGVMGKTGGTTALYSSTLNVVEAQNAYAEQLVANDFSVNAIVVDITDGLDNIGGATPKQIREALRIGVQGEKMESVVSILVGVNLTEPLITDSLKQFKVDAGFSQFVPLEDASEKTLAKLADFVSRSISSQSTALGSGGASQALTF